MKIETINVKPDIRISYTEIPGVVDLADASVHVGAGDVVDNIRSESRKHEIIITTLLVRQLFGSNCELKHRPSGAPYLECGAEVVPEISISHCAGLVAVADSKNPVGVDVEIVEERVARVRERVFSDEELRYMGSSLVASTIAWTAKEALYKLVQKEGLGFRGDIALDLRSVDVEQKHNLFSATVLGHSYRLESFLLEDKVLTVAYE